MSRASSGTLGCVLTLTVMALSLPAVIDMHLGTGVIPGFATAFVGVGALALRGRRLPWESWNRLWLLVWPVTVMVALAAAGLVAQPGPTMTLIGLFTLTFFYIGITQKPKTGLALLPLGTLCWVACSGGWSSHLLLLRVPITVAVWAIVTETVGQLQAQVGRLSAALVREASTDSLTGLATRRSLSDRLDALAEDDVIVFIDLDHFKAINDRLGHLVGDQILADLGALVLGSVRHDTDLAVRFGGEEILLLLHRLGPGPDGALAVVERVRASWQAIHPDVTFSAGISVIQGGTDPVLALAAADRALYAAKAAGRNCSKVANTDQPAR